MNEKNIYREDGKLKVNITINRSHTMLEIEEEIACLLESEKEELSEEEKIQIKQQILQALNSAN